MIRAVIRNGVIEPLEPLPASWNEGRQVVVDEMAPGSFGMAEADQWSSDMNALTSVLNDAEEWREIEAALAQADREAKAAVRREMGLP
jgi:hypothetical protein